MEGYPKRYHPFLFGIFPYKPSSSHGYPHFPSWKSHFLGVMRAGFVDICLPIALAENRQHPWLWKTMFACKGWPRITLVNDAGHVLNLPLFQIGILHDIFENFPNLNLWPSMSIIGMI